MQQRMKMPSPKLKLFGTNCGTNPTLNTAAFTLVKLVVIPIRKEFRKSFALFPGSYSNFPFEVQARFGSRELLGKQRQTILKY